LLLLALFEEVVHQFLVEFDERACLQFRPCFGEAALLGGFDKVDLESLLIEALDLQIHSGSKLPEDHPAEHWKSERPLPSEILRIHAMTIDKTLIIESRAEYMEQWLPRGLLREEARVFRAAAQDRRPADAQSRTGAACGRCGICRSM